MFETNLTIYDWLVLFICFALIWWKIEKLNQESTPTSGTKG